MTAVLRATRRIALALRPATLGLATLGLAALAGCAALNPGPARPNPRSSEYLLSWGLRAVNADPAYRAGATGRGVTIALVDCGVGAAAPDLMRNLSPRSTDILNDRRLPQPSRHADYVAGTMDSALDGHGVVGVAYNATLMSVRADFDGGWEGQCAFHPADVARGLDYARENGARIVVLPLQARRPLGAAFEAALARAKTAGIPVVIAAGNDAGDEPSWPARYAADPRFAGDVVVVGATGVDGALATWSNRAGDTADYYLTAPGVGVITDCGPRFCKRVSGTSLAAPFVGGALALVMEARPHLSGPDAVGVLLRSATPYASAPGAGRGRLDIGRAFAALKAAGRAG